MPEKGLFITLPIEFTGPNVPNLPVVVEEPILVPGSLLLLDPAHPWDPMTSTDDGAVAPNLAWEFARDMIGSGSAASLGGFIDNEGGGTPPLYTREFTEKGGLHLVARNTAFSGAQTAVEAAPDLAAWLNTHYNDHDFFVAMSHRVTRPATSIGGYGRRMYSGAHQTDARTLWAFDRAGDLPPSGVSQRLGYDRQGVAEDTVGVVYRAVGVKGVYSTWQTFNPPFAKIDLAKAGANNLWETATGNTTTHPSHILYSFYIEDLTVSGRDFKTVNTLAKARHDALFATGGRYAGDAWTDPAVLLP